jgi:hypothetical protein
MSLRSRLRCEAHELSGGPCEWCQLRPGTSLCHIHSIGLGGRKSADRIENVFWGCDVCALASDGKQRNWPEFMQLHTILFGEGWETRLPMSRWGYERAEALTRLVAERRKARGWDTSSAH